MAAAKTGWTCMSPSILDSKEIPAVVCTFSGLGNLITLIVMLHLKTGNEKFKMAAAKPEVHVSQLLYKKRKKLQRRFACF
jgi:hypothetical protein